MENILELQQVSKTFPKSNFTLKNVSNIFPAVLFGRRGTKRSFSDNQLTLRYWNCYGAFYSHKYVISQDDCTAAYMRRNCYTCLFVIGICFILSFDR